MYRPPQNYYQIYRVDHKRNQDLPALFSMRLPVRNRIQATFR
jgi:hypothetical protein